jgi:uncharacterized protein (TIGR01777 family)
VVTGAGGLVGSALVAALAADGRRVDRLVRRPSRGPTEIPWDPATGRLAPDALAGTEAVIHLAGESIGAGWWNAARKARIRDSRIGPTRMLAQALAALAPRPRVLISASAVGIYGDRGDEILDESSPPGTGFLAEVARAWEDATSPAASAGIRVVLLRTGLVLAREGGALARLLPVFRVGLGGPLGRGRQWMSWIALPDLVGAIRHALAADALSGPLNAVAPDAVRGAEFARALGATLGRPAFLPAPAFALRFALGRERADALLLSSARVVPGRLRATGFAFRWPGLAGALREVLGGAPAAGGLDDRRARA